LPWDPDVVWCLSDLVRMPDGEPYEADPRASLKRAVAAFDELGQHPVIGPEHEFYLARADADAPLGFRRYDEVRTPVYTVGELADPEGVLREMTDAVVDLELGALAFNHEYGRSQYEINLRHGRALDAADRAFRYKTVVKEVAARHGLIATFIGKPWPDDEGSGFHLHVSMQDAEGANTFEGDDGLSELGRQFTAGVLAHAAGLTAFLNPTVNAYRRFEMESLAPTHANWGMDNRLCMIRGSADGGPARRIELRSGDGAANVYLAFAAVLFAGLDGIRSGLEPPPPLAGNPYEYDEARWGAQLPGSLGDALAALKADDVLCAGVGQELVDTYLAIKQYELDRWHHHLEQVTAWELEEYAHHL
jgi:glutamine synthetase